MSSRKGSGMRYAARREDLLNEIREALLQEKRFLAAWLTGSYAQGKGDDYSDIDLNVILAASPDEVLLQVKSSRRIEGEISRRELFSEFGEIANLHEAHQNAPVGGTMSSVLYTSGITVDWILLPEQSAIRPQESLLLFEKQPIPLEIDEPSLSETQIEKHLNSRLSFFWMMAAVSTKAILRGDAVRFHIYMEWLLETAGDISSLNQGQPPGNQSINTIPLMTNKEAQKVALLKLCAQVDRLRN